MTDSLRRCALPGCNEPIEQTNDGGPPRLYCSPAHRVAARKQRHMARLEKAQNASSTNDHKASSNDAAEPVPATASAAPAGAESEPSPTASWMVSPTPLNVSSEQNAPAKRSAAERKAAARRMRRRTIATIAAASLVIGGSGYVLTDVATAPTTPAAQAPRPGPSSSVSPEEWSRRAEVVLASITKQLDVINQAEAAWKQAASQFMGEPPAVVALKERKALLEQQRTILQSQLDAIRSLPKATEDLKRAEEELQRIERALSTAIPSVPTQDPQQVEETRRSLAAQREMRLKQREQNLQEVNTLRAGVEQALATPLPDPTDRTTPIVEQLLAFLAGTPKPDSPKADKPPQPPSVVRPRENSRQQRREAGRAAPPEPGSDVRASGLLDGVRRVAHNVTEGVGSVVQGVGSVLAAGLTPDGRPGPQPPASPGALPTAVPASSTGETSATSTPPSQVNQPGKAHTPSDAKPATPPNQGAKTPKQPISTVAETVTKPVSDIVNTVTNPVRQIVENVTDAVFGPRQPNNGSGQQPNPSGETQPGQNQSNPQGQEQAGQNQSNPSGQTQPGQDGASRSQPGNRQWLSNKEGIKGQRGSDSRRPAPGGPSSGKPSQTDQQNRGRGGNTAQPPLTKEQRNRLSEAVRNVVTAPPKDRGKAVGELIDTGIEIAEEQVRDRLGQEKPNNGPSQSTNPDAKPPTGQNTKPPSNTGSPNPGTQRPGPQSGQNHHGPGNGNHNNVGAQSNRPNQHRPTPSVDRPRTPDNNGKDNKRSLGFVDGSQRNSGNTVVLTSYTNRPRHDVPGTTRDNNDRLRGTPKGMPMQGCDNACTSKPRSSAPVGRTGGKAGPHQNKPSGKAEAKGGKRDGVLPIRGIVPV